MTSANNDDDDDGNVKETSVMLSARHADSSSILSRLSARSSFIGPNKFKVVVQLLDRADRYEFEYKKNVTGQTILDDICRVANIAEKEYFGLQFEDNKFRYWVDLSKTISKQFHRKSVLLRLRIRFYPTELACLREAVTRYNLFVQVHRDLLHGRLICTQDESARLATLILQASIGDYNSETMGDDADYVSGYVLVMKQSHKIEAKIADVHRQLRGMSTEEAEQEFLELASRLETYGFDPYMVKNVGQTQEVTIGATSRGILLFARGQRVHFVKWSDVEKVDYLGKQLTITPTKQYVAEFLQQHPSATDDVNAISGGEGTSVAAVDTSHNSSLFDEVESKGKTGKSKKELLRFVCPSATFAKHLWRHILSQQVFFTEEQAIAVKQRFSKPKIPLFSRGSTFRCPTGRVLHELELNRSPPRLPAEITFQRHPLKKCQMRSVDEPWNASWSSSQQHSIGRNSGLAGEGLTAANLSATVPAALSSCDGHSSTFLDVTGTTTATHGHSIMNGTFDSSATAHLEEIREAMANNINAKPIQSKRGIVAKASLFMIVFFEVLALAFLIAYVFYPDTLRRIELPSLRGVTWPSEFRMPPWLTSGSQATPP